MAISPRAQPQISQVSLFCDFVRNSRWRALETVAQEWPTGRDDDDGGKCKSDERKPLGGVIDDPM
jgi:hypothetical protein